MPTTIEVRDHEVGLLWSAKRLPKVGEEFVSQVTYWPDWIKPTKHTVSAGTTMRVVDFAVEHGYLYAVCRVVSATGRLLPRDADYPIYVAGCDVDAWKEA